MAGRLKALILSVTLLAGCSHPQGMPKWDGEFWAADSDSLSVRVKRAEGEEKISCDDPRFGQGVWMTTQSASCLYEQLVNNCEKWRNENLGCTPVPSTQAINKPEEQQNAPR